MAASLSKTLRFHRLLLSIRRNSAPALPLYAFYTSEATLRPPPPPASFASVAAPSASQAPEKERGRWSKLLLFLPGAITFGLGTWQLFRRLEKIDMLDYRRKRLEMEPIVWSEIHSLDHEAASLEFRRVICEGYFDDTKSIFVGPRSRSISGVTENGYYVITPLIPRATDPGSMQLPILVNRGWVPRGWRDNLEESQNVERASNLETGDAKQNEKRVWWKFWSKSPAVSKAEEPAMSPVRVIGVIRGSEKPSIFVPANDPNSGQWFYVDVPMIARACGLPESTIYIEDINDDVSATNPYPVPKDVNTLIRYSVMPQDHLNYTITWYWLIQEALSESTKNFRAMSKCSDYMRN
ncbi:surfeit locus protein 1 isoform X1 [Elaeis guineensis]|uniref:SURF1-like protein n=1 Tax=Elaeis guineensis var. tenera TaxID=51953 RepID=A0A6I9SGM7_ELAGV|nr:surfeit locus protein 1 isoform X2 [Elaeis guineensis]